MSDNQEKNMWGEDNKASSPEWQILEKVALASVNEQKKTRRWGILFKSLTFLYLFFVLMAVVPSGNVGVLHKQEPHVGVVALDGLSLIHI